MAADGASSVRCPSCRQAMTALALEAHYGATVELDACDGCHALWVDDRESLRLTPGATLQLFERIHDLRDQQRTPLGPRLGCPRCDLRLVDTRDRQGDAPFRYWRCGRGHGRFITFFDFLREKSFVKPLTPAQLAELRTHVRSVHCSNCGAPVDLATATTCGYCQTPISILDFGQVERTLAALRDAADRQADRQAQRVVAEATLPLALVRERRQVEDFFGRAHHRPGGTWPLSADLVEGGVIAVVRLLRGLS